MPESRVSESSVSESIVAVPGIAVGQVEDATALTGCTVILTGAGATCGVAVRGAAPGTRETDLLSPINMVQEVHAICLCGGSAYGLDAASGVMRYLEERGIGLNVGVGVVPIVPAAVLFDLAIGSAAVRPDAEMGYLAATRANRDAVAEGNVGAGCGATVGKFAGLASAMKSGIGTAARRLDNGLVVGAIVAVNAVGEVHDTVDGQVIAGARGPNGELLRSEDMLMLRGAGLPGAGAGSGSGAGGSEAGLAWPVADQVRPGTNTTIGVVASNARFSKAEVTKVAEMAHDGLARTIYPVHTMHDGDTLFALATGGSGDDASTGDGPESGGSTGGGGVAASVDVVGALSAIVLAEAVVRAVRAAKSAGGLPGLAGDSLT